MFQDWDLDMRTEERWSLPNPTGLKRVFEGYCPSSL
jgi:hypothetical protein